MCLKRLPEQRYASALALRDALDARLTMLGLDWEAELPQLLHDQEAYCERLEKRLAGRYTELGKSALAAGQYGQAMEHFDRVLCSEPDNAEVRKLLRKGERRQSRRRMMRWSAAAVVVAAIVGTAAYGAVHVVLAQQEREIEQPIAESREPATDTVIRDPRSDGIETVSATDIRDTRLETKTLPKTTVDKTKIPEKPPVVGTAIPDKPPEVVPPEPRAHVPEHREVRFNAVNVVTAYVDDASEPLVRDRIGPFTLDVTYATHRLRFTNPLAYDSEMSLPVDGGNPAQLVVVRLQPLPAKLFIDRAPDGATVEVGGRTWLVNAQTRNEPIFVPLPLGAGSQSLEVVVRRGDLEYRRTVEFKPGQERRLDVQLDPSAQFDV